MKRCPACGVTLTTTCAAGHVHESVGRAHDCDLLHEFAHVLDAIAAGHLTVDRLTGVLDLYIGASRTDAGRQRLFDRFSASAEHAAFLEGDALRAVAFLPWLA